VRGGQIEQRMANGTWSAAFYPFRALGSLVRASPRAVPGLGYVAPLGLVFRGLRPEGPECNSPG
jgi:hypothetical protein